MLYFPILAGGAAVQYPLVRRRTHPLITTQTPGGHVQRGLAGWGSEVEWELEHKELSDAEAGAIEELYNAADGGLQCFAFIDPLANLLRWSEDLTSSVWQKSGVSVTGQQLTNVSGTTASMTQSVELPVNCRCVFSCELRGAGGTQVMLRAGGVAMPVSLTSEWRRSYVTAEAGGTTAFGIEVPDGVVLEMRAPQAEPQAAPSPYKPSFDRGGVHMETRFVEDSLRVVSTGPDRNALRVVLRSKVWSGA